MASALEKILKGTLQKSDSQKAFSPWWEDLEDKLLYSLMIFGKKCFTSECVCMRVRVCVWIWMVCVYEWACVCEL